MKQHRNESHLCLMFNGRRVDLSSSFTSGSQVRGQLADVESGSALVYGVFIEPGFY